MAECPQSPTRGAVSNSGVLLSRESPWPVLPLAQSFMSGGVVDPLPPRFKPSAFPRLAALVIVLLHSLAHCCSLFAARRFCMRLVLVHVLTMCVATAAFISQMQHSQRFTLSWLFWRWHSGHRSRLNMARWVFRTWRVAIVKQAKVDQFQMIAVTRAKSRRILQVCCVIPSCVTLARHLMSLLLSLSSRSCFNVLTVL